MKKTNKQYNKHNSAFTIVELLIVIVVIAILAAITVVAYNGIQRRAYNAATISQAKQTIDLVSAYVAAEGSYPATSFMCATRDNECTYWGAGALTSSNSALMTALSTIGTPISTRVSGDADSKYGILYAYETGILWNGESQPVTVNYYLKGQNQSCGLSNVHITASTTSRTQCVIHVDGPSS